MTGRPFVRDKNTCYLREREAKQPDTGDRLRREPAALDDLGLAAALHDLVEEFSQRTNITAQVSVKPTDLLVDNRLAMSL